MATIVVVALALFFFKNSLQEEKTIQAVLPTAAGLSVGQKVATQGSPTLFLGKIVQFEAISSGVLVTISLNEDVKLKENSRVFLQPNIMAGSAEVNIIPSAFGATLEYPAVLVVDMAPANPDGLLEPRPRWGLSYDPFVASAKKGSS
ncbi:MAG: hypothetical protein JKX97_09005 [Candidatus Lindowbacteria bacterium]|nr:hypothetical protein [Candidatus Lindowbacteria bacterium]